MTDIAIIQNLFDPTTGAQIYPVTTDEAVFATDDEGNHCTMKSYVKAKYDAVVKVMDGMQHPTRLIGAITDTSNTTLIQEITDESIGAASSAYPNIEVGHAYYYGKNTPTEIPKHNIPTSSGILDEGDLMVCLVKTRSDVEGAVGYHTEWLVVNSNITMAQIVAIIDDKVEGITTAYQYWLTNIQPTLPDYGRTESEWVRWLREPAMTAAKAANDAIHELEDCSGKWIELTQAEYNERKANTNMENIPWTPIDDSREYLHENVKYILSDATYTSELSRVINEMFVPVTKAEYDALKANGQLNPASYYFISYPEVEPLTEE